MNFPPLPRRPALLAALLAAAGCASPDWPTERRDHAAAFQAEYIERARTELAEREPLDLADCLAVALKFNLPLRQAEIEANLARLERQAAFSLFLPAVELSAGYSTLDREPLRRVGADPSGGDIYVSVQDRATTMAAIRIQAPIFHPSAWFFYSARRRGEDIAALAAAFARQRLRLEVTAQFYQCLALAEASLAQPARAATLAELQHETDARLAQGLAAEWEARAAAVAAAAAAAETEILARAATTARAELMALLGLSPLASCRLEEGAPPAPPAGDEAELVLRALLNHPALAVADRETALRHDLAKASLFAFLPGVYATGGASYSSDSFLKYSTSWVAGLAGFMTVFNGFANVQEYRLARAREEEAWLKREEACLAVILQVLRARAALFDAEQRHELAAQAKAAAAARLKAQRARWREGLAPAAEMLRETAAWEAAVRDERLAGFSRRVCAAALTQAIGEQPEAAKEGAADEPKK